jgi:23S rRNA pseudouridine1911/1915/1917 synthase
MPSRDSDFIEKPLGMHPTQREKVAIRSIEDGGKDAVTFYEVLERFDGFALVRCKPKTGRTHQIRVHLAHIGHPILADKAYAGRGASFSLGDLLGQDHPEASTILLDRQALHAHALHLQHPITGQPINFNAPLPDDMTAALAALRMHRS